MRRVTFLFVLLVVSVLVVSGMVFAAEGNINWRQFEGKTINATMCVHHFTDALEKEIPQFEALTGIKVQLSKYTEEEFYNKVTIELASGKPTFDIFMLNQGFVAQYVGGGWVAPLNGYLGDPKLTDAAWYDLKDFAPAALDKPEYEGKLYGIPISVEPQILFYRTDLFQEKGLTAPDTVDQMYDAAVKLRKLPDLAGIVLRLKRGTGSIWPWGGLVADYKGYWVDKKGNVGLTLPETVAATEMYMKLLKDGGPDKAVNFGWYECLLAFQQGKTAMVADANSWEVGFQDPAKSAVAGKVGAVPLPAAVEGYRQAAGGSSWMLGVSLASNNKEAAWLFTQWATSKSIALKIALGSGNIARSSIWTSDEFVKTYPYTDWIKASKDTIEKYISDYYLPEVVKFGAIADEMDVALEEMYGGAPVKETLEKVQAKTVEILKK
ncbi:MAG: sugar ABC transporter substrate-binding protein [Candidatus Atribacteria bacterium]|nr:sugar ABC transporter substrate-binding protein [Candidatus Atribacteria bacterium]